MAQTALPTDPLLALGSTLLLNICEYLPYRTLAILPSISKLWRDFCTADQSSIWRSAARRFSIEPKRISELMAMERKTYASDSVHSGIKADWKGLCKEHFIPDVNWANGRLRNSFLRYHRTDVVFDFVVDEEDQTMVALGDLDGLQVIDLKTCKVLFEMPNVSDGSQLEMCGGYLVLRAHRGDCTFRIFRTRSAISRSSLPLSMERKLPPEAVGSTLRADPDWKPESTLRPNFFIPGSDRLKRPAEIGRGCLAFYRNIVCQSDCGVSRVRSVTNMTEERVWLGVVTKDKVFLWDLEGTDRHSEVFEHPVWEAKPVCLDFDNDHIYLCAPDQIHIISRSTLKCVLSYPPLNTSPDSYCSLLYQHGDNSFTANVTLPGDTTDSGDEHTRQLPMIGYRREDQRWEEMMLDMTERWQPPRQSSRSPGHGFLACLKSGTDLICAHRRGQLLIIRDYETILAIEDRTSRIRACARHTLILDLGRPISDLTVNRNRIAILTKFDGSNPILFFDTDKLPSLPLVTPDSTYSQTEPITKVPPIRIYEVLPVDSRLPKLLGKPQIYSTAMYSTYGPRETSQMETGSSRTRCIRVSDFGAE